VTSDLSIFRHSPIHYACLPNDGFQRHLASETSNEEVLIMKVLFVFAHPESRSLNAALRDVAIRELESHGHQVQVSDLYADGWKSEVDRADFPALAPDARLIPVAASKQAFESGTLTVDVKAEIEKLSWADVLILQFPLWWFAMPAILKGWVDRVFAYGFAYGVGEHSDKRWGDRYGDGTLAGKRAMLIVTAGGWVEHYSPRGINGPIDDLLFPINHGILYYPGYDVLPPFVAYRVDRLDPAGFELLTEGLRERMRTLATTPPIAYRRQNGGDYLIPRMQLRAGLEEPGATGFALHVRNGEAAPSEPSRAGLAAAERSEDMQRDASPG
jgi:NAD(P)H dehydrogenase (quinone)